MLRKKVSFLVFGLSLVLISAVLGCSFLGYAAPKEEAYIWISAWTEIPYMIDHKLGVRLAGEELGVKTRCVGPVGADIAGMIVALEQITAEKPAGILVVGVDPALREPIDRAIEQGIPVITLDADVPASKRYTFIGTGNYNAGLTGGEILAEAIGYKGEVALLTTPGLSNLEERIRGYKDTLAKYPDIEIVAIGDDKADHAVAATATAAILQAHPNLAGIGCVDAGGGAGAAVAVREAGMIGEIKIVAMDRDEITLDYIRKGIIYASIAQKTALMSYLGVKLLYSLHHNFIPLTTDNVKANVVPLPITIDTGTEVIVVENVDFWYHK